MWLSDLAIKRPVLIATVLGALMVFGLLAKKNMGVDLFPKVDFPTLTIQVTLPGADPETMETTVVQPIEESISGVGGLTDIDSTAGEGYANVVVQLELEKNIDVAYQEVQSRLSTLRGKLPDDATEPVVLKLDADAQAILAIALDSNLPIGQFTEIVDKQVKQRLEKIQNVGQVMMIGGQKRKIWLNLDRDKLAGYNLTVQDVVDALRREHVDIPGGEMNMGSMAYAVKTKAEFLKAPEFDGMTIAWRGATPIHLREVGKVVDGVEELKTLARVNGKRAIAVQIQKQSGSNTVAVSEAVKKELREMEPELKARGISMSITQDQSIYIEQSVEEVNHHLQLGALFAVLVVFIFLRNIRSTLISALVLPTSVLGTFWIIQGLGFTQNFMTLLALSLAIGLLIDDAIVVQENIMHHVENGMRARAAAGFATKEIALAVFATTLSVVAVFVPVAFTKGIVGRFFYQFGLTVAGAVALSMFVSFTLDPMVSSRILVKPKRTALYRLSEMPFLWVESFYRAILKFALRWGPLRWFIVLGFVGMVVVVTGIAGKGIKGEFVPTDDQGEFNVNVMAPLGSSVLATDAAVERVRKVFAGQPWVELLYSTVGRSGNKPHEGSIYVKMTDLEKRKIGQLEAMGWARDQLKKIHGIVTSVEVVPKLGGGQRYSNIMVSMRGPELDKLDTLTQGVLAKLKASGGYVDLDSSFKKGKPEAAVHVLRERAADLGVSSMQVALTVRALFSGQDVAHFREKGERYDVAVRLNPGNRQDPMDLGNVGLRTMRGDIVPMQSVASIQTEAAPVEILRHNRARQILLYANLDMSNPKKAKALSDAETDLAKAFAELKPSNDYDYNSQGQGKMMKESFGYLIFSLMMAVLIVYMVLAAQFESFLQPIVIMLALPLSIVGAFAALRLTGRPMSIYVMIGIIMLMGLVTKNGIMLVDYTNALIRDKGYKVKDAILEAGPRRLRPILMTTVAMIAGMLPVALSHGAGAASRGPMATSIIGGLVTSTLLTLLIVPLAYAMLEDFLHFPRILMKAIGKVVVPEPVEDENAEVWIEVNQTSEGTSLHISPWKGSDGEAKLEAAKQKPPVTDIKPNPEPI